MEVVKVSPADQAQRAQGWDEVVVGPSGPLPGTWSIRPCANIYTMGAVSAEVIPVYHDDGTMRGVHWWLRVQKNMTDMGPMLDEGQPGWIRLIDLDDLRDRLSAWTWHGNCRVRADLQLASMAAAELSWQSERPSGPLVIVTDPSLWQDLGHQRSQPAMMTGDDAVSYVTEHVPSLARRPTPVPRPSIAKP